MSGTFSTTVDGFDFASRAVYSGMRAGYEVIQLNPLAPDPGTSSDALDCVWSHAVHGHDLGGGEELWSGTCAALPGAPNAAGSITANVGWSLSHTEQGAFGGDAEAVVYVAVLQLLLYPLGFGFLENPDYDVTSLTVESLEPVGSASAETYKVFASTTEPPWYTPGVFPTPVASATFGQSFTTTDLTSFVGPVADDQPLYLLVAMDRHVSGARPSIGAASPDTTVGTAVIAEIWKGDGLRITATYEAALTQARPLRQRQRNDGLGASVQSARQSRSRQGSLQQRGYL